MNLLDELKRRRVARVALVYLVVAWVTIQVADTVAPRLALPAWTVTFVIFAAALDFPLALVLSWFFDITPDGLRQTGSASGRSGSIDRYWSTQ
ncbi:MAG: hypothetical protein WEE89_04180 [Gemmatimonadota bacterium]